jgi:hypothetical protein
VLVCEFLQHDVFLRPRVGAGKTFFAVEDNSNSFAFITCRPGVYAFQERGLRTALSTDIGLSELSVSLFVLESIS